MMECENTVKIPLSFVLEMDDVGWDDGRDLRLIGQASRSELPRFHEYGDYEFIKLLSDRIGKKISLALCLGDWDRDNLLRGEVGITHDPYGWDRASTIDLEKMGSYRDLLLASDSDFIIHGLLHGRYDEKGNQKNEKEYFDVVKHEDGTVEYLFDEADFRRRLDIFLKIYERWGFGKKIRAFINPCFTGPAMPDELRAKMCSILYEYGIRYWIDPYFTYGNEMKTVNGVALFCWSQNGGVIHSCSYDFDPSTLTDFVVPGSPANSCVRGTHLTNYLRFNPAKNKEQVEPWAEYLLGQAEIFGTALADGLDDAVNQSFYYQLAKITVRGGVCEIDTAEVEGRKLDCHKNEFLLSIKNGIKPKMISGGSIELCEVHKDFKNYRIVHTDEHISLALDSES